MSISTAQAELSGSCISCGFLSRRSEVNPHIPDWYEITQEDRDRNRFVDVYTRLFPTCIRGVGIWDEILRKSNTSSILREPELKQSDQDEASTTTIRREDRLCPKWFSYSQSVSPQKHLEEQRIQEHENTRNESDERFRQLELEAQEKNGQVLIELKQIAEKSEAIARNSGRRQKWITTIFVLMGLAQLVFAVFTYFN